MPTKQPRKAPTKPVELGKRYLIPQEPPIGVMVFDVVAANGKRFVLGEGLGRVGDDDRVFTSDIANLVVKRLAEFSKDSDIVYFVELRKPERAYSRLARAFAEFPTGSAIMLLCADNGILDDLHDYFPIVRHPTQADHGA